MNHPTEPLAGARASAGTPANPESDAPVLQVITPDATPEEVAALVAVLSALGAPAQEPPAPRSEWASPARRVVRALPHGPGGWRASGLPR